MPGMKSGDPHPKDKLSNGGIRGKDKKETKWMVGVLWVWRASHGSGV
jgi:hypothetical protein